ncbi:MAG TPA: hypothetical protein VHG35_05500 [Gemmatimonadales bacterium]|nr:hypothetical protein [Gemmatimonadales bacterium]
MKTGNLRAVALCAAMAIAACGDDDSFSPTVDNVAGSYTATTFTVETDLVGTVDLLAAGATVSAVLDADGTTTGRLFIPEGDDDGSDLDVDLAGTWTLAGDTVTFSQTGGSFITDVDFVASENRLTGEGTFDDTDVLLVLTKDD